MAGIQDILKAIRNALGQGSDVTPANPLNVTPGLTFSDMLREPLAGIRRSLFNVLWYHPTIPKDLNEYFVNNASLDLNTLWTSAGFTSPPGPFGTDISTAFALKYPQLTIRTIWPAAGAGQGGWVGLELGGTVRYGMIGLLKGPGLFHFCTSGSGAGSWCDLLPVVPADWETAQHYYTIKSNRWGAELYIDGVLRALQVFATDTTGVLGTQVAGPPYAIIVSSWYPTPPTLPAMFEPAPGWLFPLSPEDFRYTEGDPCPPRRYPLYDAGTNNTFAGLVCAGAEVSHPVPAFGYANKTLLFRADEAGTLDIEVLMATGNWRDYDTGIAVAANTLLVYNIASQAALVRFEFTPTAPPATITEAEVICS